LLLRTITAACTAALFADLIAQTCASTVPSAVTGWVAAHFHVDALVVIGFLLP
jgi:hypothetical protein